MPNSFYTPALGMILVHVDGTEYFLSRVDSHLDIISITNFVTKEIINTSHSDFFLNFVPYLSFYKDDEDDTLYPFSTFKPTFGS